MSTTDEQQFAGDEFAVDGEYSTHVERPEVGGAVYYKCESCGAEQLDQSQMLHRGDCEFVDWDAVEQADREYREAWGHAGDSE